MKKSIVGILLILHITSFASPECMSFGHDPYADDPDYHTPHYVECYCPCRQHKIVTRGQCTYCGHYRNPSEWIIIRKPELVAQDMFRAQSNIPANVKNPLLYAIFGVNQNKIPDTDN